MRSLPPLYNIMSKKVGNEMSISQEWRLRVGSDYRCELLKVQRYKKYEFEWIVCASTINKEVNSPSQS